MSYNPTEPRDSSGRWIDKFDASESLKDAASFKRKKKRNLKML
jgi:hypothetical protein